MDEEIIKNMTNIIGNDIEEVSLNDTIEVGCNHCGACCHKTLTSVNAFDIYKMAKAGFTDKEIRNALNFGFGSQYHGLSVSIQAKSYCTFMKVKNGDFICTLGSYKPTICDSPFIAFGQQMSVDSEEIKESIEDMDKARDVFVKIVDMHKVSDSNSGNLIYYKKGFANNCVAEKEEVLVKDYVKERTDHYKDIGAANAILSFVHCFFDPFLFYWTVKVLMFSISPESMEIKEKYKETGELPETLTSDGILSEILFEKICKSILFIHSYFTKEEMENSTFYEGVSNHLEDIFEEFKKAQDVFELFKKVAGDHFDDFVEIFKKYNGDNQEAILNESYRFFLSNEPDFLMNMEETVKDEISNDESGFLDFMSKFKDL